MFTEEDIVAEMKKIGALEQNVHVRLASGYHTQTFMDFKIAVAYPSIWERLCHEMALKVLKLRESEDLPLPDVILGPSNGGLAIAPWIARSLSTRLNLGATARYGEVLALFTEKIGTPNGVTCFKLRNAYRRFVEHANVFIIDDVFTTGSSARQSAQAVISNGGQVHMFGCFWNREDLGSEDMLGKPVVSLVNRRIPSFKPGAASCPGCRDGIPLRTKTTQ